MSIYDVGQEEDIHYIVMEYVEGHNLNEIIKDRAPLQVEETINYALQICDALDHAHQNGIIHRDIKPHNILIGKNGRVKVTDFGIARAATSSDITQTGSVIGSVHYFSPEHAKGVTQGAKSDLYSLGIVMYQMLTNQLPFLGESPISVALKHLQEQVTEPRKANPMIPQSVENIILKSLRKDPAERYQSAKEMLQDLETALSPHRQNEKKRIFKPEITSDSMDDQPTLIMPAIRSQESLPSRKQNVQTSESNKIEYEHDSWEKVRDRNMSRWVKPVIWLVFVVFLLGGTWQGVKYVQGIFTVPTVEVPGVVGTSLIDAQRILDEVSLNSEIIRREHNENYEANTVISQDLQAGKEVKINRSVGLVVSLGPKMTTIPDLTDIQVEEALEKLKGLGFTDEQIRQEAVQDEAESGTVLSQSPSAEEEVVLSKAVIVLEISEGPGTIDMPEVIDMTETEAISKLKTVELENVKIVREADYATEEGHVFQQAPAAGDPIALSDEVTLYVSAGMPEDARETVYTIELTPSNEGQSSTFEIEISDARGDKQEWGSKKTDETVSISIPVVVSPTKNARISVMENDGENYRFYNIYTVTYQDADSSGTNLDTPSDVDMSSEEATEKSEQGDTNE